MAIYDGMRFITGIHFAKSVLKSLNGMTFLYDPSWTLGEDNMATFPVAFFHIKSIHEQYSTEVSQKQMLFYNSEKEAGETTNIKGGLLNVVSDNIVIKPKVYQMDVIIPYDNLTLLSNHFSLNVNQIGSVTAELFSSDEKSKMAMNNVSSILTLSNAYIKVLKSILESMSGTLYTSVSEFITDVMSTPDYNKNSLEQMWQRRSILKFKTWNGWKYKYVAITDMRITKEGTEDGVYEASLTLQELPILTVRNTTDITETRTYINPIVRAQGEKIKALLDSKEQKK